MWLEEEKEKNYVTLKIGEWSIQPKTKQNKTIGDIFRPDGRTQGLLYGGFFIVKLTRNWVAP